MMTRSCLTATLLLAATAGRPSAADPPTPGTDRNAVSGTPDAQSADALPDASLAAYRTDLLELAFDSATSIPVKPHIRDRSRAQENVVTTCLDLDLPQRARAWTERIDNWRRGIGHASLAFYCAQHGAPAEARRLIRLADISAENSEDWRRDRIRVTIARTLALLGEPDRAAAYEADVVPSETGKVDAVRAMQLDAADFDEQMKSLDEVMNSGDFDLVRNALETCAQLFNRFYDDDARRTQVTTTIKESWHTLPVTIRLDVLMELVGFAFDHDDQTTALSLVNDAQALVDEHRWDTEYLVPLTARLAGLRWRAGDTERARKEAADALASYDSGRDTIVSVFRARTLLPLAEAYGAMGDRPAALDVYRKALEEGAANPNARPRALDLVAISLSMAEHGVEPDESLWTRLRTIREDLGDPW